MYICVFHFEDYCFQMADSGQAPSFWHFFPLAAPFHNPTYDPDIFEPPHENPFVLEDRPPANWSIRSGWQPGQLDADRIRNPYGPDDTEEIYSSSAESVSLSPDESAQSECSYEEAIELTSTSSQASSPRNPGTVESDQNTHRTRFHINEEGQLVEISSPETVPSSPDETPTASVHSVGPIRRLQYMINWRPDWRPEIFVAPVDSVQPIQHPRSELQPASMFRVYF